MHYKNGRPVAIGDFVVGVSHNSNGRILFAVVLEEMPRQGDCNIRIAPLELTSQEHAEKREFFNLPLLGSSTPRCIITSPQNDYGDAKEFLKVEDGLRLAKAAKFGEWNCPYSI